MTGHLPPPTHRLLVFTEDPPGDPTGLADRITDDVAAASNGRALLETLVNPPAVTYGPGDPLTAAVVLGGPDTARSPAVAAAVAACQAALVPVLPVVGSLRRVETDLPRSLRPVNAHEWPAGSPPDRVSTVLLRLLGLSAEDRRAFVSYRRADGTPLAEQLRRALVDDRWDVFMDRYDVPPASLFQERLDRELSEMSFVLVVETPLFTDSRWTRHEIAYALRHGLALMGVTDPATPAPSLQAGLDEAFRVRLDKAHMKSGTLTDAARDALVSEIEVRHARATNARRTTTLLDAQAQLEDVEYDVAPAGEGLLVADSPGWREVVLVTPRAPTPRDVMLAESHRRRLRLRGATTRGWVVHPVDDVDEDRTALVGWLTARRLVRTTPVQRLAERVEA